MAWWRQQRLNVLVLMEIEIGEHHRVTWLFGIEADLEVRHVEGLAWRALPGHQGQGWLAAGIHGHGSCCWLAGILGRC